MKREEKARRVQAVLDELYPEVDIPLDHRDPYTLLIAVVLSAQCTDARVNQVAPKLFARAATAEAMRQLPVEEIREIIRPCGLSPQKSKAIATLSRDIAEKYGGAVTDSFEELEADQKALARRAWISRKPLQLGGLLKYYYRRAA